LFSLRNLRNLRIETAILLPLLAAALVEGE